jgi:hypothetical protein
MNKFLAVLFSCAVLLLASAIAQAQKIERVRGTITGVDGNILSVKSREGKDLRIEIAADARISFMKRLKLDDVKPGTPLGTSAVKGPGGKLIARELHIVRENGASVSGEGHRPWDLEPDSTMTNGRVSAIAQTTGGRELTLTYKDGSQQVIVPANIPVVMAVDGDRSLLKVGEYALIATTEAGGKLIATRVQVSKDGVKPPQ